MMNKAELHLLINHLPVIVPLVGIVLLVIGIFWKSVVIRKVALGILVAGALSAIPAYLTGSPAARVVKNYPGVSTKAMHAHAQAAQWALIFIEAVGLLSLWMLWKSGTGREPAFSMWIFVLVLAVFSFVVIARTAHLGGEIHHEEIQAEEFF